MTNPLILHHYDASPYAEKIRLVFGLSGAAWQSLLSPVQPPRPHLDPLTGGYRRIPVAQDGADIFCDTAIITAEIAARCGSAALDPAGLDETTTALMRDAEQKVFFAAIGVVPPAKLLLTMLLNFGPLGMYRFIRDRGNLMRGGTTRPAQGARARAIFEGHLAALEAHLADRPWMNGDAPSLADFAIYHPLWLHTSCTRGIVPGGARTRDWYARVTAIGHGQREEITAEQAFAAARDAQPRPLPEDTDSLEGCAPGQRVAVAPTDYGVVPVHGELAAVTADRIIIRRQTEDFGTLHVHFPRAGYAVTPA